MSKKLEAAYKELEAYKSKILAEAKEGEKSKSAEELKRIVAESMHQEEYDAEDSDEKPMEPASTDEGMSQHEGMHEESEDDFDAKLKELQEELGLSEEDKQHMHSDYDADGRQEEELGDEGSGMQEADDATADIKAALDDLTEMETEGGDVEMGDTMDEAEGNADLEKKIEQAIADLQSEGYGFEEGEDGEDELSELEAVKEEFNSLTEELEGDIERELAKAMEADEESDEEEMGMEENASISHFNGKGENKKPEGFERDYKYLTRENKRLSAEMGKIKLQNKKLKESLALAEGKAKKLAEIGEKLSVFNENLKGAVSIFTESALTSKEKSEILDRYMDTDPSTIEESKKLTESIKAEFKSPANKPSRKHDPKNGGKKVIKESTSYVDSRMMELINFRPKK